MKKLFTIGLIVGVASLSFLYFNYRSPEYKECMGGDLFVVNKLDPSITKIDLSNKKKVKTLVLGIEPHEAIISADKKTLIVSDFGNEEKSADELYLVSTETFKLIKTIKLKNKTKLHGLALSNNPDIILVTSEGAGSLMAVNIQSGKIESETKTLGKESHMVVPHPGRNIAYVANIGSNNVSVINYGKDSLIKNIYCGKGTEGIDLSKDGSELWLSNKFEDSISIISTESFELIQKLKTEKMPVRLAFTNDGKYCVVSNHAAGILSVYDVKTREIAHVVEFPGSSNMADKLFNDSPTPASLVFHPSKPWLFMVNSNADRAMLVSTETWKLMGSWKVGDIPDGMAFNEKPDDCEN